MPQVAHPPFPVHPFPSHHHASSWEFDDLNSPPLSPPPAYVAGPSADVKLPRTLPRPAFKDVASTNFASVSPELVRVPAEFVRRGLKLQRIQMAAGFDSLTEFPVSMSLSEMNHTPTVHIPLRSSTSPTAPIHPTHMLAVTASGNSKTDRAQLVPSHNVVLAAHCANLPRLPPPSAHKTAGLTLPLVPLSVPSPSAFPILHAFLYAHRADHLLSALLGTLPPAFVDAIAHDSGAVGATLGSGPALHQLSAHMIAKHGCGFGAHLALAQRVKGLWKDAVALGVYDADLWDAIDLAWEVVLGSLNLCAGRS